MLFTNVSEAPRWRRFGLWAVKALLAAAFAAAGGAKLASIQPMVEVFDTIGVGQWFRYLTGMIELAGAAALLLPALAGFAALLLAGTMVGATLAHLTILPGSSLPAVILLALCLLVASAHRSGIEAAAKSALLGQD
ncbi:DoxX family protein [Bosea sp. 62]|uniref:DoxX family protein n=1 Tax=unclassified Bosea (in: a-proteobacteria) TaxID=2653178 RepID=UPI001259EB1B|nr:MULTISPECIES: DoxX family protein [unclassified Bosea (in: a-proteobacteria)]CAD5254343.1 DoxX family protein [Bosea sp. 21B]CAD5286246.1 DoxX family protein [Bosea sp. 7B]CAD5301374.1 DoxX family protein [Bosea sp. 46]VVT57474.1 DoxX family protein [Bosea sp. EC-HK365B]VXB69093.1 DoxX family protein [Bosea sp. 125]